MASKLSSTIVGIILVSLIVVTFSIFFNEISTNYDTTYDNSTLDAYNNFAVTSSLAENVTSTIDAQKTETGVFDVLGGFFSRGYQVMKITSSSFKTLNSLTDTALTDVNVGPGAEYFKQTILTIIIIIIFIGIIVAALLKWQI